MKEKTTVAVIFGGCSDEYEVSLKSAYAILTNLDRDKYEAIAIGVTRDGKWLRYEGAVEAVRGDYWAGDGRCVPVLLSPDRGIGGFLELRDGGVHVISVDVVLPVLHGKNGEDGTVQGLLELAGLPYAGCGVLASAAGMDKDVSHKLAEAAGVEVPRSACFWDSEDITTICQAVWQFHYPLYVKPANGGSSIGITKVADPTMLISAVKRAFEHDRKVVIEENVEGFEVGCAVLGNNDVMLGVVDEIQLNGSTFDYTEKYHLTRTVHYVPARVDRETSEKIKGDAIAVYRALGCRGLARVDFFLTPDGRVVFNEINTMPGFTSGSRYPKMLMAAGLTYGQILDSLILDALGNSSDIANLRCQGAALMV